MSVSVDPECGYLSAGLIRQAHLKLRLGREPAVYIPQDFPAECDKLGPCRIVVSQEEMLRLGFSEHFKRCTSACASSWVEPNACCLLPFRHSAAPGFQRV